MTSTIIRVFCGIEGGGTKTICSLVTENGEILCTERGGPTNPWLLGKDTSEDGFVVSARRIFDLINKCLNLICPLSEFSNKRCLNQKEYVLEAVGICLSGAGCKIVHDRITEELIKLGANYKICIGNDTLAPIFTACENGGIVVISGTGSKCVLVNPLNDSKDFNSFDDINSYSSGGWGNLLGDEGSAYWIAQRAIKFVIDYNDNFLLEQANILEKDTDELKRIIFDHFKISTFDDLLPYFYSDFKKDFIASLTVKLSSYKQNGVIKSIFEDSGYQIARHIIALQPKIDKKLTNMQDGLPIVCTGSVFKSWNLIKPGFIRCLENQINKCCDLNELNLVLINTDSTIGAAVLAAKCYDHKLNLLENLNRKDLISNLDHFYLKQFKRTIKSEA